MTATVSGNAHWNALPRYNERGCNGGGKGAAFLMNKMLVIPTPLELLLEDAIVGRLLSTAA